MTTVIIIRIRIDKQKNYRNIVLKIQDNALVLITDYKLILFKVRGFS